MGIHEGHRRRVKEKIAAGGMDTFLDHEILEALLFYAIPYRDTNPTAHALINACGSLSKLLYAPSYEIASVHGCGSRTADFIALFSEAGRRAFLGSNVHTCYDSADAMRCLASETAAGVTHECTYLLLFDNRLRLLDSRLLFEGYFASAALKPSMIASPALALHASAAVLVTNHANRIACADRYEHEVTRHLVDALNGIGVHLIEHYFVGGSFAVPSICKNTNLPFSVATDPTNTSDHDPLADHTFIPRKTKYTDHMTDKALLHALLDYLMPASDTAKISDDVLATAGSFAHIIDMKKSDLFTIGLSPHAVSFFHMLLPAWGRCIRTEHEPSRPFKTQDDIGIYFTACLAGQCVESVYLLLLDENRVLCDCRRVAIGSINAANFTPRALLEHALSSGAAFAVLAHNHPSGNTTPSQSDCNTTAALNAAFSSVGLKLINHYIVSGNLYRPLLTEEK